MRAGILTLHEKWENEAWRNIHGGTTLYQCVSLIRWINMCYDSYRTCQRFVAILLSWIIMYIRAHLDIKNAKNETQKGKDSDAEF